MKIRYCKNCEDWHEFDDWYLQWFIKNDRYYFVCKKTANRWRENNPELSKESTRKGEQTRIKKNVSRYLAKYGDYCKQCKKTYPFHIYELHHSEPKGKDPYKKWHYSWELLEKLLDKCILVCANCHKDIHHLLRNEMK